MVDWDHSTGEKAKASAPPTPPPKQSHPEAGESPLPAMKSPALRHISIAVQPAANAPNTALRQLIAHAGVGCPMYSTNENSLQNVHAQNVQNG